MVDVLEEYGIEKDPRLKHGKKAFFIAMMIWAIYSVVTLGFAFGVGRDPDAVILGVPWWIHFFTIAVIFGIIIYVVTRRVIKDFELTPWVSKEQEE